MPSIVRCVRYIGLYVAIILGGLLVVHAQETNVADLKQKAITLAKAQKYVEAYPILEKLSALSPNDAEIHFYLGFSLLGQSKNETDAAAAKKYRARARAAFVRAEQLGLDDDLVKGLIQGIPVDGGDESGFSKDPRVEKYMSLGEAAFSRGELDEALANYQNALKLDPKLYHAALFSGDVYVQQGKYTEAEIWYQKAIGIDPMIETAYRYSATPLMKQKRFDEARDRYIESFITAPYDRIALSGIVQWANVTGNQLGHPKIDIPEITTGADGKINSTINVTGADDGTIAWVTYSATRTSWAQKKFREAYPNETQYRHTLREEAEALRSVITAAKASKAKSLHPQLATLMKLDQEGLLEAYILLARPDEGIARDHRDYLRQNREKLRLYVKNYVIGKKE